MLALLAQPPCTRLQGGGFYNGPDQRFPILGLQA